MFSRIQALRFRCLRCVDQPLGRFATLVGPNASGKTTFLDVIALLQDLMQNGGDIVSTIQDRSTDFTKLLWKGEGQSFELAVEANLPDAIRQQMAEEMQRFKKVRYEIEIGLDRQQNLIRLQREAFWLMEHSAQTPKRRPDLFPELVHPPETLFLSTGKNRKRAVSNQSDGNANYYADGRKTYNPSFRLGTDTAAMGNIPADRDSFHAAPWFRSLLKEGVQSLALNSYKIRQPSPPGLGKQFQADGSNLPFVLAELRKDRNRFNNWLDHVRTSLPDIEDIRSVERPEDKHRYIVIRYEGGAEVPSWLVSDGTLRLLALTIPAYLPDMRGVFLIEEPENGIHPRAIETVLQSLSSIYEGQVLLATHSPIALNMIEPKDVICFAKDANGATDIVSGDNHPSLQEWTSGEPDLGVLFASGILS